MLISSFLGPGSWEAPPEPDKVDPTQIEALYPVPGGPNTASQYWCPKLGPNTGAQYWAPILGPNTGAQNWAPILVPNTWAQNWAPILGPNAGPYGDVRGAGRPAPGTG